MNSNHENKRMRSVEGMGGISAGEREREDGSTSSTDIRVKRLKSLRKADHSRFATRLETLRRERGWTVTKLARNLGMRRVTVSRWLHGRQLSRASIRRRLSRRVRFHEPNYEPVVRALKAYKRIKLPAFERCFKLSIQLFSWLKVFGFRMTGSLQVDHITLCVQPNKTTAFWLHFYDDGGECAVVLSRYRVDQMVPDEEVAGLLTIGVASDFLNLLLSVREPYSEKTWPELPRGEFGQVWIPALPDYQAILKETEKRDCGPIF